MATRRSGEKRAEPKDESGRYRRIFTAADGACRSGSWRWHARPGSRTTLGSALIVGGLIQAKGMLDPCLLLHRNATTSWSARHRDNDVDIAPVNRSRSDPSLRTITPLPAPAHTRSATAAPPPPAAAGLSCLGQLYLGLGDLRCLDALRRLVFDLRHRSPRLIRPGAITLRLPLGSPARCVRALTVSSNPLMARLNSGDDPGEGPLLQNAGFIAAASQAHHAVCLRRSKEDKSGSPVLPPALVQRWGNPS